MEKNLWEQIKYRQYIVRIAKHTSKIRKGFVVDRYPLRVLETWYRGFGAIPNTMA